VYNDAALDSGRSSGSAASAGSLGYSELGGPYVFGSLIDDMEDPLVEYKALQKCSNARSRRDTAFQLHLPKPLCGMLNSNQGGTVYLGTLNLKLEDVSSKLGQPVHDAIPWFCERAWIQSQHMSLACCGGWVSLCDAK